MSTIFDEAENKTKCQKFTPAEMADAMLDMAGYTHDLSGKKVWEHSFGSGNILCKIVERYIVDALKKHISTDEIANGLSEDVFGVEFDKEQFDICVCKLNGIAEKYAIPSVNWSLCCTDALKWDNPVLFDFVIGNPPYITYKKIDSDSRDYIRENYRTCKSGKYDYCYAFLEKGMKVLNDNGKMVQLVPSNIYKNVFGKALREQLSPHIIEIREYPEQNKFGATLTSSSIFLYDKGIDTNELQYRNETEKTSCTFSKDSLGEKWVFAFIKPERGCMLRFGDYFNSSVTVATLLNDAFLIEADEAETIEPQVIRFAAAPRTKRTKKEQYLIFPYGTDGDSIVRYSEEAFLKLFPNAYNHLNKFKNELLKRDSDKSCKWFEYGRSQALSHLNQRKLLMSTVVTNRVELYELAEEEIPYSGIYVTVKDPECSLEKAKQILKSYEFLEYVKNIGISVSGKSKRITCKDINNYCFREE